MQGSIVLRFILGTVILVVGALAVCFYFLVRDARDAARSCSSQCRLNQLQLALQNYHDAHGCFPPAYIVDEDGRPMHSWRALIISTTFDHYGSAGRTSLMPRWNVSRRPACCRDCVFGARGSPTRGWSI
ncbi:MAG: DUF1559 domain-containing protein [Pirellulaceae bacterium]|nr:DUF1559 domain-containing protein [Pirellulaceae bacterium]